MRRHLRWLERLLLVIGIVALGYYAYVSAEAALYQALEDRELDAILASAPAAAPDPRATILPARMPVHKRPAQGASIGRIEIPRLGVSAIIRAGSDARTLRLAVGYIPGTALPGERGNTGLAAHRDTFFRRLRDIRTDDEIRIVTKEGTYRYEVDNTRIVQPKDVWVLNPTPEPALTLVTCYPFNYIGSAPERFIVRAELSR
jgi:sortase A